MGDAIAVLKVVTFRNEVVSSNNAGTISIATIANIFIVRLKVE
jgi:hypothetical protein